MKTVRFFVAAFIVSMLCVSCSSDDAPASKKSVLTFSASVDELSRVTMDESGGKFGLLWDDGDEIAVMALDPMTNRVSDPQTYKTSSAGLPVATFTPSSGTGFPTPAVPTVYFSYYPASYYKGVAGYGMDGSVPTVKFKIYLDFTQYINSSYLWDNRVKYAMAGMALVPGGTSVGTPGALSFRNIGAVLRLSITCDPSIDGVSGIDSIMIHSGAGEKLGGDVIATVGTDGVVRSVEADPTGYCSEYMIIHTDWSDYLSATTRKNFDIVIPPKTYAAGMKIEMNLDSYAGGTFKHKRIKYVSSKPIQFKPGAIYQIDMLGLSL